MQFEVSLTPVQQRMLAFGLALVPLCAVCAMLAFFVTAQIDHHTRVALLSREFTRERALLDKAQQWEDRLASMKSSSLWQALFVQPSPNGQPGATARMIKNAGGTIDQSSVKQMETDGATELDEHIIFRADIKTLTRVLTELRKTQPVRVIRTLIVDDQETSPASPRLAPNMLRIEISVAEFVRPS